MEDKLQLLLIFSVIFYISYTLLCKNILPMLNKSFNNQLLNRLNNYCKENSKYNLEFILTLVLSLIVTNIIVMILCNLDLLSSNQCIKKNIIKLDDINMQRISMDNPFKEFLMQ